MTEEEKTLVYRLAQKLTGAHPEGTYQIGTFLTNIQRRMHETGHAHLTTYLEHAQNNPDEHSQLLSALSIHTTSWFRENPHYVILQKILLLRASKEKFKMWSCATSTGEEVYSFALLFEEFRRFHPEFDYHILGTDIDPISLKTARRAIYDRKHLTGPVSFYKKHVKLGSGKTEGLFTFSSDVRNRCEFREQDIRTSFKPGETFDLIVCRNVLIYFQAQQVQDVVAQLLTHLRPGGHLILGHSEMIDHQMYDLILRGHAVYEKPHPKCPMPEKLSIAHPRQEIESETNYAIRLPSEVTKLRPFEAPQILREPDLDFEPRLILIGASTGGPQALAETLWSLPANCPPVLIVQHISSRFLDAFSQRLSEVTGLKVGGLQDNEILLRGHFYCATPEQHLGIQKTGSYFLRLNDPGSPVNGHKPSVDFLFRSARAVANECIAILLSGMGRDGAAEIEQLHNLGAYTLAQSEKDCVVFGMPKEAIVRQAIDFVGTTEQIHDKLFELIRRQPTEDS